MIRPIKSHRGCLVPRRLSLKRARKGRREGDNGLYPSQGPLRFITSHSFRPRLCQAKNEAPEEEAATEVCEFRAKNPAFYRRLQLAAPSLSRSISDTSTTRA